MRTHYSVGIFLRESRKRAGLSQSELASKIFKSKNKTFSQVISNVERGLAPIPEKSIEDVCDILGVSLESFLLVKINDDRANIKSKREHRKYPPIITPIERMDYAR